MLLARAHPIGVPVGGVRRPNSSIFNSPPGCGLDVAIALGRPGKGKNGLSCEENGPDDLLHGHFSRDFFGDLRKFRNGVKSVNINTNKNKNSISEDS